MSVDVGTVKRVAHLARIAIDDAAAERLTAEMNQIIRFVDELSEVEVGGVEPMTAVGGTALRMRADRVTDGGIRGDVLANAPEAEDGFFVVPKVVE